MGVLRSRWIHLNGLYQRLDKVDPRKHYYLSEAVDRRALREEDPEHAAAVRVLRSASHRLFRLLRQLHLLLVVVKEVCTLVI